VKFVPAGTTINNLHEFWRKAVLTRHMLERLEEVGDVERRR